MVGIQLQGSDQINLILLFQYKAIIYNRKSPHTKCEKSLLWAKECQQSERQGADLFAVFNKVGEIPEVIQIRPQNILLAEGKWKWEYECKSHMEL